MPPHTRLALAVLARSDSPWTIFDASRPSSDRTLNACLAPYTTHHHSNLGPPHPSQPRPSCVFLALRGALGRGADRQKHRRDKDEFFGWRARFLSCVFASDFARDPLPPPPHDTERGGVEQACLSLRPATSRSMSWPETSRVPLPATLFMTLDPHTYTHARSLLTGLCPGRVGRLAPDKPLSYSVPPQVAVHAHTQHTEIRGALLRLACTYPLQGILVYISSTN
jgi:hypothetical protein